MNSAYKNSSQFQKSTQAPVEFCRPGAQFFTEKKEDKKIRISNDITYLHRCQRLQQMLLADFAKKKKTFQKHFIERCCEEF